jgi:hypothetical protein
MSDYDDSGRREYDADELRDAWLERRARARRNGPCRCGNDLPGTCPGPANCPMCQEEDE